MMAIEGSRLDFSGNKDSMIGSGEPASSIGKQAVFSGTGSFCSVETFRSGRRVFTEMSEYRELVDSMVNLYTGIYPNRDEEISAKRMEKSLSYPKTILELVKCEGVPVGYGIFSRVVIEVGEAKTREPVMYASSAFLKKYRDHGLGRSILERAIRLHQQEVSQAGKILRLGAFMTQNEIAEVILESMPIIDKTRISPFVLPYDQDVIAQDVMLGIHKTFRMASRGIDAVTGVSTGELSEIGMNENALVSSLRGRAAEVRRLMVDKFGMNRERGDVMYIVFGLMQPKEMTTGKAV